MNISDFLKDPVAIATFLLALVTFILAIAAFGTIWQNHKFRERDRKENLLNEIIEWAEDIRKSSSESIDPSKIVFDSPIEQVATQSVFRSLRRSYQDLNKKSVYMKKAIDKVFRGNLPSAAEKVVQKLDETIGILGNCIEKKDKENFTKVEEYKKLLYYCAEELIIEATKIKTRDIS